MPSTWLSQLLLTNNVNNSPKFWNLQTQLKGVELLKSWDLEERNKDKRIKRENSSMLDTILPDVLVVVVLCILYLQVD